MEEKDLELVTENEVIEEVVEAKEPINIAARFKSWPVWLSILGAVGIILCQTGLFDKWGIDMQGWDVIVNAIGAVLIGFGVLNNPTSRDAF